MSAEQLNNNVVIEKAGEKFHMTRNEVGEPLVKDLELARWLGFENQYKIRDLVQRHAHNLGEVVSMVEKTSSRDVLRHGAAKPGEVSATVAETSKQGGRPGKTYYLTEQQALFIAAKSETSRATEVLKQIIEVFVAVRRGRHG